MRVRTIPATGTHHLRRLVLRKNDPDAVVSWPGDDHPEGFHLGAFIDDECIGIASVRPEANSLFPGQRHYRLRGMATLPGHQGMGVGSGLLQSLGAMLRERNAELLWCNAREEALSFYRHNGFRTQGEPFLMESIGVHYLMYLFL